MKPIMLMCIDSFQFWKKLGTNIVFTGDFNKACHKFIDGQTELAKAIISTNLRNI